MVPTETQAPPARAAVGRKPPTPKALQERKLTLADAAAQFERTTLAIEGLKGLRDEAAAVLTAHFEKTGGRTYKDRITRERTGGTVVLDQPKVKEHLGDRLSDFQTTTKLGWTLKLLRD